MEHRPDHRPRLTPVLSPDAIEVRLRANDPQAPGIVRGAISAEARGDHWTIVVTGSLDTRIVHATSAEPFSTVVARIRGALIEASYPTPAPTEHPEVATRVSSGYGS